MIDRLHRFLIFWKLPDPASRTDLIYICGIIRPDIRATRSCPGDKVIYTEGRLHQRFLHNQNPRSVGDLCSFCTYRRDVREGRVPGRGFPTETLTAGVAPWHYEVEKITGEEGEGLK